MPVVQRVESILKNVHMARAHLERDGIPAFYPTSLWAVPSATTIALKGQPVRELQERMREYILLCSSRAYLPSEPAIVFPGQRHKRWISIAPERMAFARVSDLPMLGEHLGIYALHHRLRFVERTARPDDCVTLLLGNRVEQYNVPIRRYLASGR